ncbi:3-hydroxyacyl-CoA dehydrogenase family protein, partial [Enterococcus faecium]|uniref:3-hydroxyacyl-CoA dehydrogenase family protein n=1 Tax=Enterococcus faecium TaxID=1352 RepID=UPI003F89F014
NAVTITGYALQDHQCRFNGWPGFYEKKGVEIAGSAAQLQFITEALDTLTIPYIKSPDVPGMLAARVVAMIINEAYFGRGEGISSKADIDIAMKLGTNYPYGPFEWGYKIGVQKILELLQVLSKTDDRYTPAKA